MISVLDNTTEEANKLGMSFQLDFHLNKWANFAYTPSLICIAQQFLHFSYEQCIAVPWTPSAQQLLTDWRKAKHWPSTNAFQLKDCLASYPGEQPGYEGKDRQVANSYNLSQCVKIGYSSNNRQFTVHFWGVLQ